MITFRLADSLPESVVIELARDRAHRSTADRHRRMEMYLDTGHGDCLLGDPRISRLVEDALYIHANPLKAGLVRSAEDWAFSSYRRFA